MGWKSFFIVVKPVVEYDRATLLEGLGYGDLVPVGEAAFERAIYPDDDTVYIGQYKDCLLICDVMLSSGCLSEEVSPEEAFLMKTFPNTEIGVFVLQSTVNFWGYALLADGQKIRARGGSSDDGTFLDHGAPLSQEMSLLSKAILQPNGSRLYPNDYDPEQPMTEDQVGEEFVFALAARFFNERLDRADELMFETMLQAFGPAPAQVGTSSDANPAVDQTTTQPKPWWKFW